MDPETAALVRWLVETEPYDWELPGEMAAEAFLEHWCELARDFEAYTGSMTAHDVDRLTGHASHHIGDVLWDSDVDLSPRLSAVRVAPGVLGKAGARGEETSIGCYMSWENLLLTMRKGSGAETLLEAIHRALTEQAELPDDNVRKSAMHGLQHYEDLLNE